MININLTDNRPVLGVVGGTGPYASSFFHLELLHQMQKIMRPKVDQDYMPIILDNDPLILGRSQIILLNKERGGKWKKGDLLILNNLISMHGRMPFSGQRLILVAMS
jgi:hypothetical protein